MSEFFLDLCLFLLCASDATAKTQGQKRHACVGSDGNCRLNSATWQSSANNCNNQTACQPSDVTVAGRTFNGRWIASWQQICESFVHQTSYGVGLQDLTYSRCIMHNAYAPTGRLLLLQELVEDVVFATSSRHADLSWARRFAVAIVRDSLAAGPPPRFWARIVWGDQPSVYNHQESP